MNHYGNTTLPIVDQWYLMELATLDLAAMVDNYNMDQVALEVTMDQ